MKDFAGSSITYYGLAREKVMNKYPGLISVLIILALICMTGLTIFLISDLITFASNSDHNGVLVGLDLWGSENSIASMTGGKDLSGNIGANSSQALENVSLQTSKSNFANLSQIKASSSSSLKSVDANSNSSPAKKHHSSSSSSSSSSAKSAQKSNDTKNLTQERSNASEVKPAAIVASLSPVAFDNIANPAKDTLAREPVTTIKFRTQATLSSKSGQGLDSNNAQSSKDVTKNPNPQAQKAQNARAKLIANKNRMAENIKKKAAQSRARAASK
jgi:hypothetical protein